MKKGTTMGSYGDHLRDAAKRADEFDKRLAERSKPSPNAEEARARAAASDAYTAASADKVISDMAATLRQNPNNGRKPTEMRELPGSVITKLGGGKPTEGGLGPK